MAYAKGGAADMRERVTAILASMSVGDTADTGTSRRELVGRAVRSIPGVRFYEIFWPPMGSTLHARRIR